MNTNQTSQIVFICENSWLVFCLQELKRRLTRAALTTPSGVESAAGDTADIHRPRKPTCDERTNAKDRDQDGGVQKKVSQTLTTDLNDPRQAFPFEV